MKFLLAFVLMSAILGPRAFSQDSTSAPSLELSGSVSYSYSHTSWQMFPYLPLIGDATSHTIEFTPSVGLFATPELEPLFEIGYSFSWLDQTTSNYSDLLPPSNIIQGTTTNWSHSINLGVGAAYNFRTSNKVLIFAGAMVRVSWTHVSTRTRFPGYVFESSTCYNPSTTFPVLFSGIKVFFNPKWAMVGKLEYSHQFNIPGMDQSSADRVSLSGGFSVFL